MYDKTYLEALAHIENGGEAAYIDDGLQHPDIIYMKDGELSCHTGPISDSLKYLKKHKYFLSNDDLNIEESVKTIVQAVVDIDFEQAADCNGDSKCWCPFCSGRDEKKERITHDFYCEYILSKKNK